MNIKRLFGRIANSRGSSLIMALVTITVLMLLGLAAITVSMSTLTSNVADATTNDSYYAAEAGVNASLDQLKLEVSRYYMEMKAASSTDYPGKFNNFADNIASYAQNRFTEPSITGGSTQTTFRVDSYDSANNAYVFLVTTTSTMDDGTKYEVQGRLKVKRVDVRAKSWFVEDAALVVGGTLDLGTTNDLGLKIYGKNAIVGTLSYYRAPNTSKAYECFEGAEMKVDNTIGDRINDVLNYPSYNDPIISSPKTYLDRDTTINWSNVPASPVNVDTAPGISITFSSPPLVPTGVINCRKNITINGGGPYNCDIYSGGNFTGSNCIFNGDIYSRGDLLLYEGSYNGDIYCDGNVTLHNASINGSIFSKKNITVYGSSSLGSIFAEGSISLNDLTASGNVIYSKTNITFGNASLNAIVFSGGNMTFSGRGGNITGTVIVDDNATVKQGSWPNIRYVASDITQKLANIKGTFFDPGGVSVTLDSGVLQGQSITAKGRVN